MATTRIMPLQVPVRCLAGEQEPGPAFRIACGDGRVGFRPKRLSYVPVSK